MKLKLLPLIFFLAACTSNTQTPAPPPTEPKPVPSEPPTQPPPTAQEIPVYNGCPRPNLTGKTWYVDPAKGSMDGDGSAAKPWRTLQEVFSSNLIETRKPKAYPFDGTGELVAKNPEGPIKPGDTILLMSGDHGSVSEFDYFNAEFIKIAAAPGETPKLKSFTIEGGSKWVIEGLTFVGKSKYALGVMNHSYHGPGSSGLYINNTVMTQEDVSSWTADDWTNNSIFVGIQVSTCSTAYRNKVKNIRFGINAGSMAIVQENEVNHFSADAFRLLGSHVIARKNIVLESYNADANHDDGFQSWTKNEDVITDHVLDGNMIIASTDPNRPFQPSLQGIFYRGHFENLVVQNNVIIGTNWQGIGILGVKNALVFNNTVVSQNPDHHIWIKVANADDGTPSTGVMRNNISNKILPAAGVTADHNLEIPLLSADPFVLFDNALKKYDLHLKAGSVAINGGSPDGAPLIDIEGNKRDGTPDIGAYEVLN